MRFPEIKLVTACAFAQALSACASNSVSEKAVTPAASAPGATEDVGFFVVGDTGYISDQSGITKVANAIAFYCQTALCNFGMMTGDNIYPDGAAGDDGDAAMFQSRFVEPYGPLSALGEGFRIYVGLGNHDWYTSRKGALAQVSFHETTRPFYMDGLFYRATPAGMDGEVELFIVDTEMLLAPERLPDFDEGPNGEMIPNGKTKRGGEEAAIPTTNAERRQVAWLTDALKSSNAKWKIVLGHHPLWQSRADSKYRQSIRLREMLMPALCAHADAYVAGHQHTLELHSDSCTGEAADSSTKPLAHIVSGAGAKQRALDLPFQAWQQTQYPQLNQIWADGDQWGFAYLSIEQDVLEVRMMSVDAKGQSKVEKTHVFYNRPG